MLNDSGAYEIYCDGSCWTGDRVGSYAWVVVDDEDNEEFGGGAETDTTISRMELMGALDALDWLYEERGPSVILVQSDSQYVVLGITDRRRKRKTNTDLWDLLDAIVDAHELVVFEHVKGHAGDHYNEMVDDLAGKLRKEAQGE